MHKRNLIDQFNYKTLVQKTVTHGSVDQIEFDPIHQLTHPVDFKLESFVPFNENDRYNMLPTFIGKSTH